MFQKIKNYLFVYFRAITQSIAFYPTVILLSFIILAIVLRTFDSKSTTEYLLEHTPYLVIDNAETARAVLTTLIGGIISLMVFSFSMVMVLLNQASSNFSPRLLPGLISNKNNQLVLGFYLGSIVYNIMMVISILPDGNKYTLNSFSILLGIIFGICCLGLFIFFIHSISTHIQINNILEKIFGETKARLIHLIKQDREQTDAISGDSSEWHIITNNRPAYYQGVNKGGLLEYASKYEANIIVLPHKGMYLLNNVPMIKIDKKISQEEEENIKALFIFSNARNVSDNYVLGIRQITEVGIKAMSPGINDPGTAVMTIDYLTELLALRMQVDEHETYRTNDKNPNQTVQLKTISFRDLVYNCFAAYRQYCKHDIILMKKIVEMVSYLTQQPASQDRYHEILADQLDILKEDSENNIKNQTDKMTIIDLIESCKTS